jgi:hypothetical protein
MHERGQPDSGRSIGRGPEIVCGAVHVTLVEDAAVGALALGVVHEDRDSAAGGVLVQWCGDQVAKPPAWRRPGRATADHSVRVLRPVLRLLPRRAHYADRTAAATDRARGSQAAQPGQQVMVVTPTAEVFQPCRTKG